MMNQFEQHPASKPFGLDQVKEREQSEGVEKSGRWKVDFEKFHE
jgi:hypothetical protein